MARKKNIYMVVDTETATLPFADTIAKDETMKKRVAIARPLVYNIGWSKIYRSGEVIVSREFLVAETFSVPSIFNTAYYKEKRPIYLEMLNKGDIQILPWNDIMEIFLYDLADVDFVGAYNSMFDYKKAIPFTDLYISKLYSPNYYEWEKMQYCLCENIANGRTYESEKEFDGEYFTFRDKEWKMFDIWGMACEHLLNKNSYRDMCLNNGLLTNSGEYFKSSAETSYRYLCKQYDFEEAHTALADVEIECQILVKILSRHAVTVGIQHFPFKMIGCTDEYVLSKSRINKEHVKRVYDAMGAYVNNLDDSQYASRIVNKMERLMEEMGF